MPVRIRARDWGAEMRRRLAQNTKLAREAALETAARGEMLAVAETDDRDIIDRGRFKRGWSHAPTPTGAVMGNDAPHALPVELGRRPGQPGPPLQPIVDWVRRKLVPLGAVAPDEVDEAAFLIRQAIHHRGTPPQFLLRDLTPTLRALFKKEVRRRLRRGR